MEIKLLCDADYYVDIYLIKTKLDKIIFQILIYKFYL